MSSVRLIRDYVNAPRAPSFARLREGVFGGSVRRLAGLVRFDGQAMRVGPIVLLTFGEPVFEQPAWRWPITGGLLARRPGGWVVVGWHQDELYCELRDYQPRLPGPIFLLTQLPFHHMVTRLALLDLRGRAPAPGVPAEPVRRLAAAALDAVVCGAIVAAWRPRRPLASVVGTAVLYHVAFWTAGGQTPGACLAGIRVVSADGSRIRPVQALLRVVTLPLGVAGLRARHDDLAGTEVVRACSHMSLRQNTKHTKSRGPSAHKVNRVQLPCSDPSSDCSTSPGVDTPPLIRFVNLRALRGFVLYPYNRCSEFCQACRRAAPKSINLVWPRGPVVSQLWVDDLLSCAHCGFNRLFGPENHSGPGPSAFRATIPS